MYSVLSLFSGVGGLCFQGLEIANLLNSFKVTQCVEISQQAQTILKLLHPEIALHDDIKTFTPGLNQYDVVCGGFPCTGTSQAGNREGLENIESSLWFEMFRVIQTVKPKIVLVENPTGVLYRGGIEIINSLAKIGYVCQWETIPASTLGLPHKRERVFIIGHTDRLWFKFEPSSWKEQVRKQVTQVKLYEQSRNYKPGIRSVDDGIPIGILKRNRKAFNLKRAFGLSCTPRQSAIAWLQINHHKTLHAGSSVSLELRGKRLAVLTALFFLNSVNDAGLQCTF